MFVSEEEHEGNGIVEFCTIGVSVDVRKKTPGQQIENKYN